MRRAFPSVFRLIALFLVMTVMNAGMAMAAYVCPQLSADPARVKMMNGAPCIGMDDEKPVQCGEFKSGAKAAPDHLAATPALAPVSIAFVIPVIAPSVPQRMDTHRSDATVAEGTDPPYLQTLRIRL